jgi:hypothetical protein
MWYYRRMLPNGVFILGFGAGMPAFGWIDRTAFSMLGPFAEASFQAALMLEKNRVCAAAPTVYAVDTSTGAWEQVQCGGAGIPFPPVFTGFGG